jgi:hypothetical protein
MGYHSEGGNGYIVGSYVKEEEKKKKKKKRRRRRRKYFEKVRILYEINI